MLEREGGGEGNQYLPYMVDKATQLTKHFHVHDFI